MRHRIYTKENYEQTKETYEQTKETYQQLPINRNTQQRGDYECANARKRKLARHEGWGHMG